MGVGLTGGQQVLDGGLREALLCTPTGQHVVVMPTAAGWGLTGGQAMETGVAATTICQVEMGCDGRLHGESLGHR